MRQRNIFIMLTITLLAAVLVITAVLFQLYRNTYYIPEAAVTDLCAALEKDGIFLSPSLVSRKRQTGVLYMGTDNDEGSARRLAESEIKNIFTLPDGTLYLHYNGDCTEFHADFRFRYRRAGADVRLTEDFSYSALLQEADGAVTDSTWEECATIARTFLEKGDGALTGQTREPSIEIVVTDMRTDADGTVYVQCMRRIDGMEITENNMICVVKDGVVTEADGKWCFMTFGESYVTQVCDITNILFMMKRIVAAGGNNVPETICIESTNPCYSLYFLPGEDSFCLIPCIRVETDTYGILVFSQLDSTLYTRITS